MADQEQAAQALSFLNRLQASSEALDLERASGFIVESYDPATNRRSHYGAFTTAPEAMAWAEKHQADVNKAAERPGDRLFQVRVYPIWSPR